MELLKNCPICGSENFGPFISGKDYFLSGESFEIVSCRNCGLKFTNPRPELSELGGYYKSEEYISHSDTKKGVFSLIYQLVRKYTLCSKYKLIRKFHNTGSILDIGCATGQFLNYMALKGWNACGIEPDDTARGKAISEFGLNVYPPEHLNDFEKLSFDVITMWHVLEHVSDLNERMNQIRNLLNERGTLILAVPNSNAYDAERYGKHWAAYDLPRHLFHFTKTDIKRLVEKYEFTIVKTLPMRFDSFYVSLLSEKYKSGKVRWIPALWNGFWSNLKSGSKRGHSSQIYVIKKKF